MGVNPELLEILVCPNCRGDVEEREDESVLACVGECGYRYPVRDGIPIMLIDEAEKPGASGSGGETDPADGAPGEEHKGGSGGGS